MNDRIAYFTFNNKNNLNTFKNFLRNTTEAFEKFGIIIPNLAIEDGAENFPRINKLLNTRWTKYLYQSWEPIATEIELSLDPASKGSTIKYIQEILGEVGQLARTEFPKLILLDLKPGDPISGNSGLHGGCCLSIKSDCAIIGFNQLYPELFYHEFSHFLGAEEGYNTTSFETNDGCENCWMQYDPRRGSTLCTSHVSEIRGVLGKIKAH